MIIVIPEIIVGFILGLIVMYIALVIVGKWLTTRRAKQLIEEALENIPEQEDG
jgi:H+/gluconate symporter-like permease